MIVLCLILIACVLALAYVFLPRQKLLAPTENGVNSTSGPADSQNNNVKPPASPPPASRLDQCISAETLDAKNKEYARGSILVGFTKVTSFSTAVSIINSFSLKYDDTDSNLESNFASGGWLTVFVPKGEEFKWACTLRDESNVRYTEPNFIIRLRE